MRTDWLKTDKLKFIQTMSRLQLCCRYYVGYLLWNQKQSSWRLDKVQAFAVLLTYFTADEC